MYEIINFIGAPIAVLKGEKWGYMDHEGNMISDFQYDSVGMFFDKSFFIAEK